MGKYILCTYIAVRCKCLLFSCCHIVLVTCRGEKAPVMFSKRLKLVMCCTLKNFGGSRLDLPLKYVVCTVDLVIIVDNCSD